MLITDRLCLIITVISGLSLGKCPRLVASSEESSSFDCYGFMNIDRPPNRLLRNRMCISLTACLGPMTARRLAPSESWPVRWESYFKRFSMDRVQSCPNNRLSRKYRSERKRKTCRSEKSSTSRLFQLFCAEKKLLNFHIQFILCRFLIEL